MLFQLIDARGLTAKAVTYCIQHPRHQSNGSLTDDGELTHPFFMLAGLTLQMWVLITPIRFQSLLYDLLPNA